ncbi:MAG: M23 family metallopeptidase [Candidatus Micrarchaeota archaeon]|nr:M23 family metallopeptidase [Candidatus Micrarchaeota archaeon]
MTEYNTLPVSRAFMAKKEDVLAQGLVSLRRTSDQSRNVYIVPVPKEAIIVAGSRGISPAHEGQLCNAIDFYVPEATPVLAAENGTVISVFDQSNEHGITVDFWDRGNYIEIKHRHGETTWYEHLAFQGAKVKVGDRVKKGQVIALSGNTGFSENPHLHFQVNRHYGPGTEDYETLMARLSNLVDVYSSVKRFK